MIRTSSAPVLALLLMAASSGAAAEVEHPAYKSWSRYPVGTTITVRSVTESPNSKLTTTTTYKLLELKPDMAVLETRVVSDATGRVVENRPERLEQQRMFPLFPGVKPEDIGKPRNASVKGEEALPVLGRELKTVWYETKDKTEAGENFTRTWLCDEVPGRLTRAVTRIPQASTTVTLELVRFDVPGKK